VRGNKPKEIKKNIGRGIEMKKEEYDWFLCEERINVKFIFLFRFIFFGQKMLKRRYLGRKPLSQASIERGEKKLGVLFFGILTNTLKFLVWPSFRLRVAD
jgi:hypothetical protein